MKHPLYLIEQGCRLSREGQRLVVTKDDKVITQASTLQISQVILFGNIQITTPAVQLLLAEGIEVVYLTQQGRFYGRLVGEPSGHAALRIAQVLASQDPAFALATARQCVRGKLHNMRVFLQRYARRREEPSLQQGVDKILALQQRLDEAPDHQTLMGLEGQATAIYFSLWPHLLKEPWSFDKRIRRPPTDPVNALISFAYTLLTQNMWGAVLTAGLDPYIGFLHQLAYNRPSLVLDLVEEFRPIVADSVALRCLNNAILTPDHFETGGNQRPVLLSAEGVRLFIREFETRLTQKFKHPASGEQVHYRRLFLLQAYALARTLAVRDPQQLYQPILVR